MVIMLLVAIEMAMDIATIHFTIYHMLIIETVILLTISHTSQRNHILQLHLHQWFMTGNVLYYLCVFHTQRDVAHLLESTFNLVYAYFQV